ncbi:efflux RND transporter periplasmic adaptor subunit [Synechocystis sp. PCC 7509]|uniref:efflux RND transporter periplasmic adaptor subunit n=1 Tax=Synechocystis sp. PCC 7509 TaxID=927677 RepID=UPI0002ABEB80|nr:efflux RND transporter periplasmic adaptor subunit [Synechocystis sp. PCC 7509]
MAETVNVAENQKTVPEMEQVEEFNKNKEVETDLILVKKPRQRKRGWLVPMLLGTGIGIGLAGLGMTVMNRPNTTKPAVTPPSTNLAPTMTVTIAPAQLIPVARSLNVTGTVNARDLIPVLPQATGLQIKQILADEGDSVKQGQTLAVLDNSVLQTQIAQAKAEVESNRAVVSQRVAALAQARATLAEANSNLARYRGLADAGAISRQELETRSTTATTAREAISVAQANIASAEADVRISIARVQQQQTQLNQTIVRAPASGIIAEQTAQVGDVANSTQKIFSIIQNGSLELQAKVPATNLNQVKINAPTVITSDSDSRVRLQGNVREIAPLVDPQSREATVRIDIPANSLLRPGMFASSAITIANVPGIAIPAKAVLPQTDSSAIAFILTDGDIVRSQKIEVGEVIGNGNVEIIKGLKVGDRVVVAGAGYLKDGDKVQVVVGK